MELFGYLCSPLCKAKADSNGIRVPVFAGQKSVVEAKLWRKVGRITFAVVGVFLLWLGVWFWYAWFGSQPSPAYAVHFEETAFSGQSAMLGKDQLVYIHGGELARHDLNKKKPVWTRNLVDMNLVKEQAQQAIKELEEEVRNSPMSAHDNPIRIPPLETMIKTVQRATEKDLKLRVLGDNIWVITSKKLIRFDKDTGTPNKEIALKENTRNDYYGMLIPRGDDMMQMHTDFVGNESVAYINLNTCETREEIIRKAAIVSKNDTNKMMAGKSGARKGARGSELAGLPLKPGSKDAGKPMDPKKVADQAAHLSLPERIALPATLSNTRNQDKALAAADDPSDPSGQRRQTDDDERMQTMMTKDGFMQFSSKLLERRVTERVAMKPAPAKSALDGNITAGKSLDLANEMLNEMQRENGGAVEREDQSRYKVSFKKLEEQTPWTGEVVGPPSLYPLKTVDILASNKKIEVFDKTHKKMWESALTFNIGMGYSSAREMDDEEGDSRTGEGPCVERKDCLYVFDKGVLTAFDLATGNARWRLPSVGISGLFFDDEDHIYLNTTSAGPDTLKYTRQIDISARNVPIVIKVDAKSGHALWASQPGGPVAYVSGKFVYSMEAYAPYEDDDHPFEVNSGFETRPFLRVKRLNPKNGHQMWEYSRQKSPYDVQFDKNVIRVVFKNDVLVLKYFTL